MAAALDGIKDRDGREIWASNLNDFLCGIDEGWGERVEAALREGQSRERVREYSHKELTRGGLMLRGSASMKK